MQPTPFNFAVYLFNLTVGLAAWNYHPTTLIGDVPLDFWWGWIYYTLLVAPLIAQFVHMKPIIRIITILMFFMVLFNVWWWIGFLAICHVITAVVYTAIGGSIIGSFFYGVYEGIKDELNKKD